MMASDACHEPLDLLFAAAKNSTEDGSPLRKRVDGQIIEGRRVCPPFIENAALLSIRGGEFQHTVRRDLSIGDAA
jgi:uncharacterized linocin/CFP29 family protein